MTKTLLFLITVHILSSAIAFSQAGEWTWMHGSNLTNSTGYFGVQGVPTPNNQPPALYGPAKWKDHDGNFWIFGGTVYPMYNTLWKFDVVTNEWTWMKGSSVLNDPGSYGTMGIPSPTNNPGSRAYGAASWVDADGNLWLFGGNGYTPITSGMLADIWKYDVATNEWTWMAGNPSDLSNFGTLQVPAASNTPGMREECTANWVDGNGCLWFYGGLRDGFGATDGNDMWKFDPSTNLWTWMSGSTAVNLLPSYGTQGVFDPANNPGGRMNYSGWQDDDGMFWLFGGENESMALDYSDLWKFDPSINQWAWISASSVANNNGSAGASCDTSQSYYPGSRFENRASWLDSCGNFWLFGGYHNGDRNDLWVYQPSENIWSFVGGSLALNQFGNYGTIGVSSPTNVPGGRMGAISFYDNNGNLWLFGGTRNYVGEFFNDLWKFTPDPSCPGYIACEVPQPFNPFNASDTDLCEKFCIDFFDLSSNNPTSWEWLFPGGTPPTSIDQNPTDICYSTPGIYDVTLITNSAAGADTVTLSDYITVYATPPFPIISQNGNTLTTSTASSYQWQFNSVDIPGATNQSYTATQTGYYTIVISDLNGCQNSTTLFVSITGIEDAFSDHEISIYPNPTDGIITVEINRYSAGALTIKLHNMIGQLVFSKTVSATNKVLATVDLTESPSGAYWLDLHSSDFTAKKKVIVSD